MTCDDLRAALMATARPAGAASFEAHLAGCAACAAFARRLAAARDAFGRHHAGVEPDAGFAARVIAALPRQQDPLAWAAMRLLPAALALVLVLAGWALFDSGPSTTVDQSPTDDLLGWVLHDSENGS